jgi:hypothetical protein
MGFFEPIIPILVIDDNDTGDLPVEYLIIICLLLSLLSVLISIRLIGKHLRHFSQPIIQRKIIAILWMVPIYGITSWLSLRYISNSMFMDMLRDCYEGFVIYMFFALCYCYIGQCDREHIELSRIYSVLSARGSLQHPLRFPEWCGINQNIDLRSDPSGFLLKCKKYVLQFVLIKPLGTITAIILSTCFDCYENGNFSFNNGYVYVTAITNISITLSMYWLILFYQATKDALAPFDPVPKFLCIKGVLFFSYWQSVVISLLVKFGVITELPIIHYTVEHVSATIQNSLICLEMVGFAIAHGYAFPAKPFFFLPTRFNSSSDRGTALISSTRSMIRNAIDIGDMMEDIQEVAPALPIPRFLRRHSSIAIQPEIEQTAHTESSEIIIPSKDGLESILTANQCRGNLS